MLSAETVMNDIASKLSNDCQPHARGQVDTGRRTDSHAAKNSGGLMDFLINILCGDCTFVKISSGMLLTRHIEMEFDSKIPFWQLMAHLSHNYVINTKSIPGHVEYWPFECIAQKSCTGNKEKQTSPPAWAC